MSATHPAQLVQANEQLVLAILRAQAEAKRSADALLNADRLSGLDEASELPRAGLLLDHLQKALAQAKAEPGQGTRLALLLVDLDNFKEINNTLGQSVGDQVLKLAARRIATTVRPPDMVSRHGGDEFLVLLVHVPKVSDALDIGNSTIAALGVPCTIEGHVLRLAASIGISIYPDDGDDASGLIDRAVAAMYGARHRGIGCFVFEGEEATSVRSRELRALESLRRPLTALETAQARSEQLLAQQRQANEQLVLAALSAQDLQASAVHAHKRQTELLAVVAHELRNPLAPISNAAVLLGRLAEGDAMLPKLQGVIERQVAHLKRLVEDLLDISRVNTGKLRVDVQSIDLVAVIDVALDACRPAIDLRLQHLDIRLPQRALRLSADVVRLAQVFSNLLDNASKYTHVGGQIGLHVEVEGDSVVTTVSDSGIGITAEALPHVFDPFVQEVHATVFNGVGLGIGLTVVRELVFAHGGTVSVSSPGAGLGTSFVVRLPLEAMQLSA